MSVGLEVKCPSAFKAQDWRESVSVLALLQVCCMTLCKALSFFLQTIRLVRQAFRSGIVKFNSWMFVNCYRSVFTLAGV